MHFLPKLLVALSLSATLLLANLAPVVEKFENQIESLIIKDLSNKKILYAKETHKEVRPASLTKIMTAILAIESGKMNEVVTITPEMTLVELYCH
ncbi:D-alanyl-D-alanine carboxypeptidase dacB precursor [Wolinella succinogenes]|uniref:hypothetical protein n=1 Tax=Wolinella succinogenes TaxID=844 RepID=UPI000F71C261|nr:hypothetical protein [Wolinella succinogenes]VEG80149.1 D-alanyl-D-alanine carboxypeptidase dacB precursor [Wolinella succinogenes]